MTNSEENPRDVLKEKFCENWQTNTKKKRCWKIDGCDNCKLIERAFNISDEIAIKETKELYEKEIEKLKEQLNIQEKKLEDEVALDTRKDNLAYKKSKTSPDSDLQAKEELKQKVEELK